MSKQDLGMLAVVLGLMVGGGLFLNAWKSHQKMGQPGVRLVASEGQDASKPPVDLPDQVLEYVGKDLEVTVAEQEALPPDTTITKRRYTNPNGFYIDVMVVLMGLDRTSIHKPQYCLTGAGFHIQETQPTQIQMIRPEEYALPVMQLKSSKMFQGQEYSGLLYYWFVDDQHVTGEHYERMWLMAKDLFTKGQMQRWAYIAVSSYSLPGNEKAVFRHMQTFIKAAVPEFQTTIPRKDADKP